MSDYYWDDQIEYLRNTRWLYYNDDYLEFLVQRVWKIEKSVDLIDYGCGYGYLGLKLLPILPEGSTYTGLDKGEELIKQAKEIFSKTSYQTTFIVDDIETSIRYCDKSCLLITYDRAYHRSSEDDRQCST
ncbi:methyltransferase domain-containing protein [Paenibacillus xylanexedens]|uniref:methyltransferase domain-containing protein n=1 Tax=Paenibacillus xylanexedens TaxID=528191 RepID=UPI001F0BF0F0|nr:methyltransferase domain-containing protein [Paenibacillus xylanexedens]